MYCRKCGLPLYVNRVIEDVVFIACHCGQRYQLVEIDQVHIPGVTMPPDQVSACLERQRQSPAAR